jgi:hypothetical protein
LVEIPTTIYENAQWLIDHPGEDLPGMPPIQIFRKENRMNTWGPDTHPRHPEFGPSDPANLVDGGVYTLDHRRLAAYDIAGTDSIPVVWMNNIDSLETSRWQFTTKNWGMHIIIS